MALTSTMPVQVLKVGEVREFKDSASGRVSRNRTLQCFTGDVVGEIRHYLRDDEPDILDAGHYTATIGWGNYQGKLTPRIIGLEPRGNVNAAPAAATKEAPKS